MTAQLQKTQVDLAGLMRVLSEALYSTPAVAIRELVQNAHDSCVRRKLETGSDQAAAIAVRCTPGSLIITDNGAGLTVDEIHAYLATVGTGYTRKLRDAGNAESLIGYFGLGFLSAFAVSQRVEVWTCSYQSPQLAHRFISRSGETYTVEPAELREIGTEVRLSLRSDIAELNDIERVRWRLQRYCCLLDYPVSFNGAAVINADPPPWRRQHELSPLRLQTLSLEFARRFETSFAPLTTIALNCPEDGLAGVLWIQDASSFATSDNRNLSVFVRGMLIGEDERELLPRWAGFVGGVIESSRLQPTASRETLRRDESYERVGELLHEQLVAGLAQIAQLQPATWRLIRARHNEALLGAALVDEQLFSLVSGEVTVPTTEGDFTLPALLERCAGKVYVSMEVRSGVESVLLRALKLPVVLGNRYAAAPFCTRYTQLCNGELVVLGTQEGNRQVFRESGLDVQTQTQLASWFAADDRQVKVCRFEPSFLPFALVVNREVELKRRLESEEADRRMGQAILGLARNFAGKLKDQQRVSMYLNAAHPVIHSLIDMPPAKRDLALALLQPLAGLSADAQSTDIETAMTAFANALLDVLKEAA